MKTIYDRTIDFLITWGPWIAGIEFTLLFVFSAFIILQTRKFSYRGVILFCSSFLLLLIPVIGKLFIPTVISILAPIEIHIIITMTMSLCIMKGRKLIKKIPIHFYYFIKWWWESLLAGLENLPQIKFF